MHFATKMDAVTDTERYKERYKEEQTQFLMVDYEEQLAHEFEDARNELYKQVTSLAIKLNLLWEVVRTLIVFFIPVITGLGLSFLSKSYLPGSLAVCASTIFNGITIGLVFLNLMPMNEAITNYLDSRVYTPSFVNCQCKKCHDRNNCSNKQMENKQTFDNDNESTENPQGSKMDDSDQSMRDVPKTDADLRARNIMEVSLKDRDASPGVEKNDE